MRDLLESWWQNPEYRAQFSAARKAQWLDAGYRIKVLAGLKLKWQDQDFVERIKAAQSAAAKIQMPIRWQDPTFRELKVAQAKAQAKKQWQDPIWKARQGAKIKAGWAKRNAWITAFSADNSLSYLAWEEAYDKKIAEQLEEVA